MLYHGDMEEKGRKRLVEAKPDREGLVPVRGLSCSTSAMPMLGERFPTYRSFAASLLPEIYTERCLDEALELRADHFESGVYINDGEAHFTWQALPRLAQASPGYGVVATDLDGDGQLDIQAVQNLFTREPETGLWRGGIGVSLRVDDQGRLHIVPPTRTGIVVDGDGKGLTVCDLDGDGWPDLVATQNNDRLLAFRNTAAGGQRPLMIELRGPAGNPTGVGARVTVIHSAGIHSDGQTRTAEIYAGSGYLSQSTARLYFGAGPDPVVAVRTRWPDGRETITRPERITRRLRIDHPDL